eukprot:1148580-Pelagomonas_calceolata.AAC.1
MHSQNIFTSSRIIAAAVLFDDKVCWVAWSNCKGVGRLGLIGHRSSAKSAPLKMLASCAGTHGPLSGAIEGVVHIEQEEEGRLSYSVPPCNPCITLDVPLSTEVFDRVNGISREAQVIHNPKHPVVVSGIKAEVKSTMRTHLNQKLLRPQAP